MNQENKPFDFKAIWAILAFFIFYFAWQNHLAKKYPGYGRPPEKEATAEATTTKDSAPAQQTTPPNTVTPATDVQLARAANPEKTFVYSSGNVDFQLSSKGMGFSFVEIKNYTDKDGKPIRLGEGSEEKLFEMRFGSSGQTLDFNVREVEPGHYIGKSQVGQMQIERELKFDSEKGAFENKIKILNPNDDVLRGVSILIPEKIHTPQNTSFFNPSYEHQDLFVVYSNTKELTNFSRSNENMSKSYKDVKIVALGSQYFASALLDKSEIIPEVSFSSVASEQKALAQLLYKPAQLLPELNFAQIFYAGPKSIDVLGKIDQDMAKVVDFGMLSWIAKPLLLLMKWLHSGVMNWGLAIILLTLIVRFVVLPFNVLSYRSMKAMQKIQPLLTSVREKYKEDPTRMHQETMAIMKQHKANPLGGCLPMLIQIPIFFALYTMIGSSIELYQAPFFLWIQDLSASDKFYVFPVLMGITMFIQQKMTPTAIDPVQAKILAFLPLIFTFFMLQQPSGLTLYMFVSTLFGIVQQWYMLKDNRAQEAK